MGHSTYSPTWCSTACCSTCYCMCLQCLLCISSCHRPGRMCCLFLLALLLCPPHHISSPHGYALPPNAITIMAKYARAPTCPAPRSFTHPTHPTHPTQHVCVDKAAGGLAGVPRPHQPPALLLQPIHQPEDLGTPCRSACVCQRRHGHEADINGAAAQPAAWEQTAQWE